MKCGLVARWSWWSLKKLGRGRKGYRTIVIVFSLLFLFLFSDFSYFFVFCHKSARVCVESCLESVGFSWSYV